jgi:hypothetical protein
MLAREPATSPEWLRKERRSIPGDRDDSPVGTLLERGWPDFLINTGLLHGVSVDSVKILHFE